MCADPVSAQAVTWAYGRLGAVGEKTLEWGLEVVEPRAGGARSGVQGATGCSLSSSLMDLSLLRSRGLSTCFLGTTKTWTQKPPPHQQPLLLQPLTSPICLQMERQW